MKQFFPILQWLPQYSRATLRGDVIAGLTVGVMLIPQGMAYAMIAGLPPIYGLYASTIPIIIYSIFGTSRQLAVGPVAMVSLLTAASVGAIADGGTELYLTLSVALAFLVGLIQFGLGVFRMGFLVNFLSHPVISGFTSAAALIIGLSQLKHLLGVDIPRSHHIHEILHHAFQQMSEINVTTLGIGVGGILLIKIGKSINKSIPGPLLAVLFGIVIVRFFNLESHGVQIVGEVPSGLPAFSIPSLDISNLQMLIPAALTISLVSFMESIAVAKAIQAKHKDYNVIPNQELIGLGLANIGGSFFQSYPVTGGFSRTAVNDQAGAKTGMAGIIAAMLIILTLLFFTSWFYYLPKAILASVIMVAVFGLIDAQEAKHLWHTDKNDFWMLAITFFATLTLGIELGIGLGVLLSLAMIIYKSSQPHMAELGNIEGTHLYRNVKRYPDVIIDKNILIVRFDEQLYFANTGYFKEKLEDLIASRGPSLQHIIINANSIKSLDSSAIHMLEDFVKEQKELGRQVSLTGLIGPVRDRLRRSHLPKVLGDDHMYMDVHEAVIDKSHSPIATLVH